MITLRPYQEEGVAALRASFAAGNRAPLYVLPTGGGKTAISGRVAHGVAERKRIAWFVVPSLVLLAQTKEKFAEYGIRCGVIHQGYTPDATAPVQVITVQTLDRWCRKGLKRDARSGRLFFPPSGRRPAMWAPDLMVLDEAHHGCAAQYLRVIAALPDTRLLGVTATPLRLDGKGLGAHVGGAFDTMVTGPNITDLIDMGYLVTPVVFAPPSGVDLSGVHTRAGDFAADEAAARMDKPAITGSVVGHYGKLAPGKRAVAFCCSIQHSQHVAAEFRASGVPAAHMDGETPEDERRRIIAAFSRGELRVLSNCSLISEGFDVPAVEAAILLRPTQSLSLYLQQVGRALRPAAGKERAIILDHVGNVGRHGMPDEDRVWRLEGKGAKRKGDSADSAPPVRQCPSCFATHRPALKCPSCGHVYEVKARELEHRDGELAEVDREQLKFQRAQEVRTAQTREDLERIAKDRGYKAGWVEHMLKVREQRQGQGQGFNRFDAVIEHQQRIYGGARR